MIGNNVIGPFVLPPRLSGALYLQFLQKDLPDLLEDIFLELWQRMKFMHDGAPPHITLPVRVHLNNI